MEIAGWVVVAIVGALVYSLFLSARGEVVGGVDSVSVTILGRRKIRITVRRIGSESVPPTVQFHAKIGLIARVCIFTADNAAMLAQLVDTAAGATQGDTIGEVDPLRVVLIDTDHGVKPCVYWSDGDNSHDLTLERSEARRLAQLLWLAATPGKTLAIAKANHRRATAKTKAAA